MTRVRAQGMTWVRAQRVTGVRAQGMTGSREVGTLAGHHTGGGPWSGWPRDPCDSGPCRAPPHIPSWTGHAPSKGPCTRGLVGTREVAGSSARRSGGHRSPVTGPCMCDLRGQKRAVPVPRSQVGSLMSGFLRLRGLLTRCHPLGLCDPRQGVSWFRRALGEATARVVQAVGGTGQEAAGQDTSQPSPQHGPLCRLCSSVAEGAPCAPP